MQNNRTLKLNVHAWLLESLYILPIVFWSLPVVLFTVTCPFCFSFARKHFKYSSLNTDQQDVYVRLFCFSSSDFKKLSNVLVNLMFFLPLFLQIRYIMRVAFLACTDLHKLQEVFVLLTPLLA